MGESGDASGGAYLDDALPSQEGQWRMALRVVEHACDAGATPDVPFLELALSVCGRTGKPM